jgi:hypothetical protein
MKKFSLALLALAMAFAISTSAWATPTGLCSADSSVIAAGTQCTEGSFTFTFDDVSIIPAGADGLYFNPGEIVVSGNNVVLAFQVLGGNLADFNLVYDVTGGPTGTYQLDNSFAGSGSISEEACTGNPSCGTQLAYLLNQSAGVTEYSGTFASNGSFYIDKDVSDDPYSFSEFTDSIEVTPEPSSLLLLGTGLLGLAFVAFRKAKASGAMLSM